ncbi:LysR family transcriptional regulator [Bordetella holmesii]|uniref:LysR family transcriptional regulator n=1 Tax=Bordetella holmesii TaxID=35814 RepID=UPI000D734000|nr:LysR family transcriptional regulator [Bordetella holmesii]AWP67072.1 LysR family transcriptional regulator [Bordetella holmesii]QGF08358.1 LysR family transcriptional regulator [Bordetella holmesii]
MELRDLRYFEVIAELGNVGHAAQMLHRTQPALSSSIRRLEASCGNALFERSGRGLRLTPAGEVLLRWAKRLKHDVQDAKREMTDLGQGIRGHVRLGIVPTAAQFILPAAVKQLLRTSPGVTLSTVVGVRDELTVLLSAGEIDLMVISEHSTQAGFVSEPLHSDHVVVVACANHPLLQQAKLTLKDMTHYDWVLQQPGSPTRAWIDQTFDSHNLPRPRVRLETTMLLMLPALIAATDWLGFFSVHRGIAWSRA